MRTLLAPLIFIGMLIFCFIPGCTRAFSKTTFFNHSKLTCASFGVAPSFPNGIEGEPPAELAGTWRLEARYKDGEMQDFPFEDVITFGRDTMAGNDTCNQIWGNYDFVSPRGQICNSSMTALGCGPTTITETDQYGNQTVTVETRSRYDAPYPQLSVSFEVREGELWFYLSPNEEDALIFRQEKD